MEDSDSGGLISTEDDPSEESSGSTGHAHMEKKISKLKLKLRGFQNVSKNLSHYSPILSWKDSYLPLLLVIRYVLAGETSAPQWQKFHTDDVKFVRNLVKKSDWST